MRTESDAFPCILRGRLALARVPYPCITGMKLSTVTSCYLLFLVCITLVVGRKSGKKKEIRHQLTIYLIETPFNAFVNRADTDQQLLQSGSSCKSLIRVYSVCLWKYDTSGPTLVDLTSNFLNLCTNMKVYLYNYS